MEPSKLNSRTISMPLMVANGTTVTPLPLQQLLEKRDEIEELGDPRSFEARHSTDEGDASAASKPSLGSVATSDATLTTAMTKKHHRNLKKKAVRFMNPLVTSQHYRPKTRPEEMSLLYFDEDELDLLEEDRETTSRDQFEMIAQELSENRLRISIAYQNRWRDHRRRHNPSSSGRGLQLSRSMSDV